MIQQLILLVLNLVKTSFFPGFRPKKHGKVLSEEVFLRYCSLAFLDYIFTAETPQGILEWMVLGGIVVIFGSIGDLIEVYV